MQSIKQSRFLDIMLLAAVVSPCFLFTKTAEDIPPITLVALRVGIAGLLLLLTLKLKGVKIPLEWRLWKYCFTLGFFVNGLPFVLLSYTLALIPTSLSALLNGMTPIITIFLANIFLQDEKLNLNRALGVILGLLGFLVLFLPGLLNNQMEFNSTGILLGFICACLYAVGAVFARKYTQPSPPLVAPTLQLLTSLVYLVPAAIIFESPTQLLEVPLNSWISLGIVAILTAWTFIVYHKIISQYGATYVAMSTYLFPIFATILGILFLNESLTMNLILAGCFIMAGLSVSSGMIPLHFKSSKITKL